MKTTTFHGWYRKNFAKLFPLMLILPSVKIIMIFCFYPMIRAFLYAFYNYQRTKPKAYGFIKLENFRKIFTTDSVFLLSTVNSFKWVVSEVLLQLVLGLCFALILNQQFKGRGIARIICFVPWAVSGVMTTMLWRVMYNENIGLINNLLSIVGLGAYRTAWLQNIKTVFPAIVVAELWRGIPFFAITMLSALQGIPGELFESAKVDGGSGRQILFRVTLPYIRQSIVFATLMRVIWEIKSVDLIMTMTNGGPMRKTTTLPIYIYQKAIVEGNYGYGSALSVILFIFLSIFAVFYLKANDFGKGIHE